MEAAHAACGGAADASAAENAPVKELATALVPAVAADADAERGEDAYARHFRLVLTAVARERADYRALFARDELAVAERFLSEIPPVAQRVYARLFQRRGPWLKTASLFRYFRSWDERRAAAQGAIDDDARAEGDAVEAIDKGAGEDKWMPTNKEVQQTLGLLIELAFLEPLPGNGRRDAAQEDDSAWRDALHAVEQCATAGEMAALHKTLVGSSGKNRRALQAPTSSKATAAATAEPRTGKAALVDSLTRLVGSQRRIDGSRIPVGRLMQQIWVDSYPLAGKAPTDHVVVRVAPRARDVLRRMHRLYYFRATPPFAASVSQPSSSDFKRLLAVARSKLRDEPAQWPGLLVLFKKVQYPTYALVTRRPAFTSAELFVCYEAARQLRHLLGFLEQFLETVAPESPEPDLELKWVLGDSMPPLMAFRRLVAAATALAHSGDGSDEGFELLETDEPSWQLRSWEELDQVLEGRVSTLDDLVLLAKSCFKAYMAWTEHVERFAALSRSLSEAEPPPPSFFATCNAGHHLARALHTAVTLYEKQRKYQVATLLLNELLAAPFLRRKRGYWWERLALNLEHLQCREQARQTCANALSDPLVLDADRITIERRYARLQGKLERDVGGPQPRNEAAAAKEDRGSSYRESFMVGRPLNRATGEKSRFVGFDDEPCSVEQLVLQYYRVKHCEAGSGSDQATGKDAHSRRGGWYGVHCEGLVLGNLFGVFMWDVLYASVPDVFQTPFQSAPLDFGHAADFCRARRRRIDERLAAVERGWSPRELLQHFADTWGREKGKRSRFVRWPRADGDLSLRFLLLVVVAMGRASLAALLRYMTTSEEFHRAQNGLPDLLLLLVEPVRSAEGPGELSDSRVEIDTSSGCLDLYAYCGMDFHTNMNPRDASLSTEPAPDAAVAAASEASEEWQDALQFLDATKWRLQLKLVEVKGPRDRLSDKQELWLRVLTDDVGLDASVMHVVEEQAQLDKRKDKRKQPKQPASKTATRNADSKKRRKG